MRVYVYSIDKIFYEGDAEVVTMPTVDGEISVLANHAPIVTTLREGKVVIKSGNNHQNIPVKSGFAEISQSQTILLVK
jgi:F-type H+-transporting ATPase subunit epsilon